jgi:cytochrome c oxidase cbb3-type subunit 3
MKRDAFLAPFTLLIAAACTRMPGRPAADSQVVRPEAITAFEPLYGANCAGCHGENGRHGAAAALADPHYLAIADDATIRRVVSNGVPGTAMPAFAQAAGGMLTPQQIDAIVAGMRQGWARPQTPTACAARSCSVHDTGVPPYSAPGEGDRKRGAVVYQTYCASCHGAGGRGGEKAGSIVDGSFLALVSNQSLRTMVIVGRPDLGAPDFRGNLPGRAMSSDEVSDVVAWLSAQRPQVAGQPYPAAAQAGNEGGGQ